MQLKSFLSENRNIVISVAFLIFNTITILSIFNTEYFDTLDKVVLNLKLLLLLIGICFAPFFITLKYLKSLSISKLFLIFIITRILLFSFFTILFYNVETDTQIWWQSIAENILKGRLFQPYHDLTFDGILLDRWRLQPPLIMWWYTLNYIIYGLNPFTWRLLNLLLELGIIYIMYKIFKELKVDEKYFKIGLAFYIFSVFPIFAIGLYANFVAFPILLGFLGILAYLKSRTNENYIYLSILFFTLNALSSYYGAVWLLGLLLLFLFNKKFSLLIVVIVEIVAIFCLICSPLLINDAIGFLQRLTWILQISPADEVYTSMWLIDNAFLKYVPALFAVTITAAYVYVNRNKEIKLEFFIVIISIFFIFTPLVTPYYLFWIVSIICIMIYSFRDFFTTYTFFTLYFYILILFGAIAILLSNPHTTGWAGILSFMNEAGFTTIIQMLGQTFFQIGLIYLIYSLTKQKKWVYILIIPFIFRYAVFFLIGI